MANQEITISEDTKKLILCKAELNSIFSRVRDVFEQKYGWQQSDQMTEELGKKISETEISLLKLISTCIDTTTLESEYKEI